MNRALVPLIEIVGDPICAQRKAATYLRTLRERLDVGLTTAT